jgi:hypothetical protein
MDLLVIELPRDEATLQAVYGVCVSVFPGITLEKLRSNWWLSNPRSTFFGIHEGGALVAVNGFLAHTILQGGVRGTAYQSCWSATLPGHRGRGHFSRIIEHAKQALRGRAAFLCGFPNSVSGPIFTGRLGFRRYPMARVVALARGPARILQAQLDVDRYYRAVDADHMVKFDQRECAGWKSHEHPSLVEVEHNTNFLWGKLATRRLAGLPVHTLLVGGCEINKPHLFGRLLQVTRERTGASMLRFVGTRDGVVSSSAPLVLDAKKTEPFIALGLDTALREETHFDVHTGLKDVF